MYSNTGSKLKTAIQIGALVISSVSLVSMAQGALSISFVENTVQGVTLVTLSGSYDFGRGDLVTASGTSGGQIQWTEGNSLLLDPGVQALNGGDNSYYFYTDFFVQQEGVPFPVGTFQSGMLVSGGSSGFSFLQYRGSPSLSNGNLAGIRFYTADTSTPGLVVWDATFVIINGTLADIGLSPDSSGTIEIGTARYAAESGDDWTMSINWSASQVPEPATYAAAFGVIILGVVAVRRRCRANI